MVYAGFCGTDLSEEMRGVAAAELRAARRKTCPFATVPVVRDGFQERSDVPPQSVRPALVVEVEYRQRTLRGYAMRRSEESGWTDGHRGRHGNISEDAF